LLKKICSCWPEASVFTRFSDFADSSGLLTSDFFSSAVICTRATPMTDYLQGLNEQQRKAVLHINGPLMIVAGAGSGKTRVLTTRIAHLMANGVDAFNILALTFTNKAAREMRERVEQILGNHEARNLYIGTFHSVFARILRAEAHRLGYPAGFTIYDTDDSKSVVKTVINELQLDDKHYKPNIVFNRISAAKNALVGPEEYKNDWALQQEDMRANRPAIGQIYEAYAKRCFRNGAMDFDDLLYQFYRLLTGFPEALIKYQRRFRYILIDEYQDTNPAQYEIIKLLGAQHENVCVVGDDAQSIYSFRGATIQNILQFQKDYDDVTIIKLEQNYRSTQSILNIANEVIRNNKGQIPKVLWTENAAGEKIRVVRTMTDNDEGKFVADAIQEQKLRNHYNNKDFAILYRTNAQSRAFEEALRRMGIPYVIYGGISFYQRKEIKDFLAYLRVTVNPRDEESLKRIINYPARGIGKTTLDKVVLYANERDVSMWEILERAREFGFRAGTLDAIENFVVMIRSFQSMLKKSNAYDLAHHVGKQTNIVKELFNDKSTEGLSRYENVQELLNSIKEWVDTSPSPALPQGEGSPSPALPQGEGDNELGEFGYMTADPAVYHLLKEFKEWNIKNTTHAESILWQELRARQLGNYKFRRQHIILNYIADFVCLEKHLIVEVDGKIHQLRENADSDEMRTQRLNEIGFEVLRFSNEDILNDLPAVLERIDKTLRAQPDKPLWFQKKSSSPSLGGGRGEAGGAREEAGLAAYLQEITLLTDVDEKDPNADMVRVMTVHAAKGLEFECVFVCGLEELLFPNGMSVNTREELEEERRLFYVAITRAKNKLWLTYANTRYRFGQLVQNDPSRFIDEMPEEYLDRSFAGGGSKNQTGWSQRSAFDRLRTWFSPGDGESGRAREEGGTYYREKSEGAKPSYLGPKPTGKEHIPSADFIPSDVSNLQVGQRVEHQKFGYGEVMKIEGSAHNPIASIHFELNGDKKIMLNYARLRIVE